MLDLAGKAAIVTGAGSVGPGWGNGKATATLLARQGARVFLVDIKKDAAEETAKIIAGDGGAGAVYRADMTRSEDAAQMVTACLAQFGRLDILVNNVGGSAPGDPVSMSEDAWNAQIAFNLTTAFLGCKYAIPAMLRTGGGAIVNISSIAGMRNGLADGRVHVAYSAAKAGVIQLSRSVAGAYAKSGIRANTVVPGLMDTPLVATRLGKTVGNDDLEALVAARNRVVPMGRMGNAWDVAHAVLFLASDEARYITGTEIIVDGGLSTTMP